MILVLSLFGNIDEDIDHTVNTTPKTYKLNFFLESSVNLVKDNFSVIELIRKLNEPENFF